jgi:hypothetical protein
MAAVSYQNGDVRLYTFPCQDYVDRPFVSLGGIATQASNMAFSSDGRYLIMLDAYTRAIITVALRQHMAPVYVPPVKKMAPGDAGTAGNAASESKNSDEPAPAAAPTE